MVTQSSCYLISHWATRLLQTYIVNDRVLDRHILAMAYVEGISIVGKCGLSILHELITIPAINGDAIYNEIRCCN